MRAADLKMAEFLCVIWICFDNQLILSFLNSFQNLFVVVVFFFGLPARIEFVVLLVSV